MLDGALSHLEQNLKSCVPTTNFQDADQLLNPRLF